MTWQIKLSQLAEDCLDYLYKSDKKTIIQINKKLQVFAHNPRQFGKLLKGKQQGFWRYKVDNYRLLCHLQNEKMIILALELENRKNI